jgi:hypothetical protein
VYRPTNPMTLICPQCGAKPGQVCVVLEGQMEVIHSARIDAAEAAAAQVHSDPDPVRQSRIGLQRASFKSLTDLAPVLVIDPKVLEPLLRGLRRW